MMGTLSVRYTERFIMRFGAKHTLLAGLLLIAVGTTLFTRASVDGSYVADILPSVVLFGAGAGLAFPSLMGLGTSGATPSDAGLVSGLINTTAQVGGALGLAVLATLSSSRTKGLLAQGTSTPAALTSGYHLAFWIAASLIVVGIGIAAVVLHAPKLQAHENGDLETPEPAFSN